MSRSRFRETAGTSCSPAITATRFARLLTGTPQAAGKVLACGLGMVGPALWERVFGLLPQRQRLPHPSEKIFKAAAVLREGRQGAYRALVSAWHEPETLVKHGVELKGAVFDASLAAKLPDALDRMQYLDAATYLPDDILTKVDRASMAVALEVRVPLLDHRVVELTWRLPSRLLMRRGRSKWLLRQVLYRHVPKHLVERPKMGFTLPIGQWLRGPLRPWAEELLSERRLAAGGLLNPAPILARWQRASRQAPRLASVAVDGADVPGVARGEGTLDFEHDLIGKPISTFPDQL